MQIPSDQQIMSSIAERTEYLKELMWSDFYLAWLQKRGYKGDQLKDAISGVSEEEVFEQFLDEAGHVDRYCFTLPDGSCISPHPRCMHQAHNWPFHKTPSLKV